MAITKPFQAYQNSSVNTASPGELTLMLYNGCLKFIHLAKKDIESKNIEMRNKHIQKAQAIIKELMVTLDMSYELSKNLVALYDYTNRRLMEANIKSDLTILNEVEEIITEFRDTWKQAIQVNRQIQFSKSDQV